MMTKREFHNGLRVLLNLDRDELIKGGVLKPNDHNGWGEFRRDPYRWFVRAPDAEADKIWKLVEKRIKP